ncbi:hypothetical protein DICVIV_08567 [Dictyocaulus viviparus]|uniref:Uncharacterized protein n=1 Tax=Dictyocaulus viviparus TaxID=29172 RepID=A0A0D8XLJ4_DICVI|nr:hypothetical protein DICVIV_08567 [Dictyocaulus viviparus]
MNSLSYSLLEVPSSIVQTATDEFDTILQEIESCSLNMLMSSAERRASMFSSRPVFNKTDCQPMKFENQRRICYSAHGIGISKKYGSIDELRRTISRQEIEAVEVDKEIEKLECHKKELEDKVREKSVELEKLCERKYLVNAVMEANKENTSIIMPGFNAVERIDKLTGNLTKNL